MSYNGVGLKTARGSGTSGHVTKNLASLGDKLAFEESKLKRKNAAKKDQSGINDEQKQMVRNQLQADLISHDDMRKIEIKCIEYQEDLEDEEEDPEAVKEKVKEFKQSLIDDYKETKDVNLGSEEDNDNPQRYGTKNLRPEEYSLRSKGSTSYNKEKSQLDLTTRSPSSIYEYKPLHKGNSSRTKRTGS